MLGKKLINAGPVATGGANTFASENFETVTYTGNGGTQRIGGYINRGGVFNGSSSKIVLPQVPRSSSMTLSCWIKSTNTGIKAVYLQNGAVFRLGTDNSGYATASNLSGTNNTGTTLINDGNWHHILAVFNDASGNKLLYVDGTLEDTQSYSSGGRSYPDAIGLDNATVTPACTIDQVRIFNKALSSSEVTTLYGETYASSTVSTTDIFSDNSGVALYQLDGNANDTGGVSGKFGSAGIFNGSNSYIDVSSLESLFGGKNTNTVSLWFKTTTTGYESLFGTHAATSINNTIDFNNGNIEVYHRYSGATTSLVTTSGNLNDGNWHNVVSVVNTSTLTASLYIDGLQIGSSVSISSNSWNGTAAMKVLIGNLYYPPNSIYQNYFDGSIDDVRIYSDVLTSTEVGYIYNNTTASIPTDNLVAYYKLDGDARDEQQLYDGTATNVSYAYNGTATNVTYQEATKFQPDLVWIKQRSGSASHSLQDSVRGAGQNYNIYSDNTAYEGQYGIYGYLSSFDTNGFSVAAGSGSHTNANSSTYVAWCFKGGGTAVSNTDGSITSQVSANQDAGFSIVKHTAPSSEQNYTIGHGLSQKPDMVILKGLDSASAWFVWHKDLSVESYYLYLHLTADESGLTQDTRIWGQQSFTDTVISMRSNYTTSLNQDYIAYCFHSVDGYSKIGSYVGDGNESGNHIVTGFEPQFVMIKATENVSDWIIFDTERDSVNPTTKILYANLSSAEQDGITDRSPDLYIEVTSNGFQIKGLNNDINVSGETFIYLAIAADPDTTTPTVENSFDVVTYTGNGSTQEIATDFKPDLVWIKRRNLSSNHSLTDSVRGATHELTSNDTNAENIDVDAVTSFNSNGFTLGADANVNPNGDSMVAWVWKAGDHDDNLPQINTEGSIDSVVSVNAAAGFSIVKYTGNGTAGSTIGHGLSQAPEMIILKNTDIASHWRFGSDDLGWTKYMNISSTAAAATSNIIWNDTAPTSTVFTVGNNSSVIGSGNDIIAYCFHSVSGYQKIGSYTGGSSGSGSVITTGFKPRFLLVKCTTAATAEDWIMLDSTRGGGDTFQNHLRANTSEVESTFNRQVTFVSNGFYWGQTDAAVNGSSRNYIYLAIA